MAACDLVYTERAENAPSASPELHGQQQCWGGCLWHRDVCGVSTDSGACPTAPAVPMPGGLLGIGEQWCGRREETPRCGEILTKSVLQGDYTDPQNVVLPVGMLQ